MDMKIIMILLSFLIHRVNCGIRIEFPRAQYADEKAAYAPNAVIRGSTLPAFQPGVWDSKGSDNNRCFQSHFRQAGYQSLRQIVDAFVPSCSTTRIDFSPINVDNANELRLESDDGWQQRNHYGPCEVWIDDVRVVDARNCVQTYGGNDVVRVPIKYDSCHGSCILTFYWLVLDEPKWLAYKHCVPITTGSQSGSTEEDREDTPTPSPTRQKDTSYEHGFIHGGTKGVFYPIAPVFPSYCPVYPPQISLCPCIVSMEMPLYPSFALRTPALVLESKRPCDHRNGTPLLRRLDQFAGSEGC